MRLCVIGLGTVGRGLLRALESQSDSLAADHGLRPVLVGAGRRDGFVHANGGIEVRRLLDLLADGGSLADLPGADHVSDIDEGLDATGADVLVEVSASPPPDGEPGAGRIRRALDRGTSVVTSNKWPIALRGVELARLARERGVSLRAESTVMSGTPVLSTVLDGLAGARPLGLRGVLNATANFILTRIAAGDSYELALDAAREAGLAERDPADDVEGRDSVAKVMVLAALVLGRQLRVEEVERRGIAELDPAEVARAADAGEAVRLVESIEPSRRGGLSARVAPERLPAGDPLARVSGATCGLHLRVDPLGEMLVTGPGAGPELAGQGVLSDLIAIGRSLRR
jgi:homoserine dehydrogenase